MDIKNGYPRITGTGTFYTRLLTERVWIS